MFSPLRPLVGPCALGAAVTLLLAASTASAQTFYSHGDPTADEQFMLELINSARANPAATGEMLASKNDPSFLIGYRTYGVDPATLRAQFASYAARPPLAFHPALIAAARQHTADMLANNIISHYGTDGSTPRDRALAAGYSPKAGVAENAGGGTGYASFEHVELGGYLVDWGVPSLAHRDNSLNINPAHPVSVEVGICCGAGFASTQNFGYYLSQSPRYLTGVAYRDLNGNGRYDQGEGIAGLTVAVDGNSAYTVTGASGGYSVPLDRMGSFTTRATGGALNDLTRTHSFVTSGENVKWDLVWGADGSAPEQDASAPATTVSVASDLGRSGFVVSRTGDTMAALQVVYHVGGAAVGGVDYRTLPGSIVIPAGQNEVFVPLVAYTRYAKMKVFLDPLGYGIGKAQSKIVLANL